MKTGVKQIETVQTDRKRKDGQTNRPRQGKLTETGQTNNGDRSNRQAETWSN